MRFTTGLALVVMIGATAYFGKLSYDVRHRPIEHKAAPTQVELNYQQCLRGKRGSVGVTSLDQMQACQKETGYAN